MRKPREFEHHPVKLHNMTFRAVCARVLDGDTYDFFIDLGLNHYGYETIRLSGFDTPEIFHPKSEAERVLGLKAQARCVRLIEGKPVQLTTYKDLDSFGRYIADVTYFDKAGTPQDLGTRLKAEHLLKGDVGEAE